MDNGLGKLRKISHEELNRLFAKATKEAAFEAQMRGIDIVGTNEDGDLIIVHPDGSQSPFRATY